MKKIFLSIFILVAGLNLSAQQDSINKALENKLIALSDSLSKIKAKLTQVDTSIQPLKDTINKIVNDQLIIDASALDSAQKFSKEVLYKTYLFNKSYKKSVRWFYAIIALVLLILMWFGAIHYAKNDSLCKDICFDKSGNQMKSQFSPYSYSRSQLLWWTLIILSCYVFFFGVTGELVPFNFTSVLLLGFGALVYSSGKVIDNMQIDKGRGDRNQDLGAQNKEAPNFIKDILSDDNGISIHRFQAVVFNLVFGIGFIGFFIKNLLNQKYPLVDFTEWQFALIGISSATYLGLKATENKDADKRFKTNSLFGTLSSESVPENEGRTRSIEYHDESRISRKPPKDPPPNIK